LIFINFVFTTGIGEHAPAIRASVGSRFAGWALPSTRRQTRDKAPRISATKSTVACYAVPTNEELMVARHALAVVGWTAGRARSAELIE